MWVQHDLTLDPVPRGFHLITDKVLRAIPELSECRMGLLHIFICHTSASLTLNENADPDVRADFETAMNHVVPESLAPQSPAYRHTLEGPDDMPAHVKASMMGFSLSIPIAAGRPQTGTWQGIYLCEHRNHGGPRRLVLTLQGESGGSGESGE
ncbi:MAG: secondary thiamine-phosphate synthase enzyme YjbQ [Planctomycetota bacterium]